MNFSKDTFVQQLGTQLGSGSHLNYYQQWTLTVGELNTYLSYSTPDGLDYRTWNPESSAMAHNLGILVSCKIDFANGIGDDHIILLTGFMNVKGVGPMTFVQASLQFHNDDSQNIMSTPIKCDPNNLTDLGQALYDSIQPQLSTNFTGDDKTSKGRREMADIARSNVRAMAASVSLS